MAEDPKYAAFVFAPDASYGLISELQGGGLPNGGRYVASVTGPWKIFAVLAFEALRDLPAISDSLFGVADGSIDPSTALVRIRSLAETRRTGDVGEQDGELALLAGGKPFGDTVTARWAERDSLWKTGTATFAGGERRAASHAEARRSRVLCTARGAGPHVAM